MTDHGSRRLVVVPSDPIAEYERKGIDWLAGYYNPLGFFDVTYALTPLERGERRAHGMIIRGVAEDGFVAALRAIRPHAVRAYGGGWAADLVCRRRLTDVPVLVSVHTTDGDAVRRSVRYADLVLCVSRAVADRVRAEGAEPSRIRILPNRVDTGRFRPVIDAGRLRAVASRFPPGRHILHVGRAGPQKNLDTLLRALALLPSDYSGIFVGSGDHRPYLALADDLGVHGRCFWIGAIPNAELPAWYSWCDCMCTPSRWEGFGIVFIEAAACGAPIVTSDIAPMNEYLIHGQSAFLVEDYEQPSALAAAVRTICEDPGLRRSLGEGALAVARRFDRRLVDAAEVAIYQEAIELGARCRGPLALPARTDLMLWNARRRTQALGRRVLARLPRLPGAGARPALAALGRSGRPWIGRTILGRLASLPGRRSASPLAPPGRALRFIRAQELSTGGIRVHSQHPDAYPEVSGYLVPTLLAFGERELARRLVRWLLCIQQADGSFTSPDGMPRVFDTAQVLRGLLAAAALWPEVCPAARRAADYLCRQMVDGGRCGFPAQYAGTIPESVLLYALPPLAAAADALAEPAYRAAAERCADFYGRQEGSLRLESLTHFLGYELDALIDLGRAGLALPLLDALARSQQTDGAVPARAGACWVCTPGVAQVAICWYKLGRWQPADRAMAWLERHQRRSGGFRGSRGSGTDYFAAVEPAWAVKFYLDAHRLRVRAFMDRHGASFPSEVAADDGRATALLELVRAGDRVAEVGCGKGRFLRLVQRARPGTACTGVDISTGLLAELPPNVERLEGALEAVPCPDDRFDVVFSVEAVEHAASLERAVAELIRIARPGGWVLVIDKQHRHWGRLECPPWERWPEADHLARLLRRGCDDVGYAPVSYNGQPPDGLMLAWRGRKRPRLAGAEWNTVLISTDAEREVVERVRRHHLSPWAQEVVLATAPGERVLEIGSGTGEISLALARGGRRVTVLDMAPTSLAFTQRCADALGVRVEAVGADAIGDLPFRDRQFDCVWSAGLLEHFTADERRRMLGEWARIARRRVIALVPNAACIAYRAGKAAQEQAGVWRYGLETPIGSLREEFEASGLRVLTELSVGAFHALNLLPEGDPLRRALGAWMRRCSDADLHSCHQGYLLVTVGAPRAAP